MIDYHRLRLMSGALAASLVISACGADDDDSASDQSTTSSTAVRTTTTTASGDGTAALTGICEAARYQVRFPDGWSTNEAGTAPPCRYFHPEPFDVPAATEFVGAAEIFDVEPVAFDRLAAQAGPPSEEIVERESLTVAGQPALRLEARATGGALLPAGTRSLRYLVALDGVTLVASTLALPGLDYERNRAVLERMVDTLEIRPEVGCSGASFGSDPSVQGLPAPVADMRREMVGAATVCNFDRLAALGLEGSFSYSFGDEGDPAAFWRRQEVDEEPLGILVRLLDLPVGTRSGPDAETLYVWPRAYAFDRWSEVPPEARTELEAIYGPDDFENFERFGSYTGYRVGIAADGDWLFFVGGD